MRNMNRAKNGVKTITVFFMIYHKLIVQFSNRLFSKQYRLQSTNTQQLRPQVRKIFPSGLHQS